MCGARVLALVAWLAVFASSAAAQNFSWDIVMCRNNYLDFYLNNGSLTHTEVIPLANSVESVIYDPVHYRLLFNAYYHPTSLICSFDLTTRKTERLYTITSDLNVRFIYEPVTQRLYWAIGEIIYWFSLNPASPNKADGNFLVMSDADCYDLAVDSCRGYIYWITRHGIERARLEDGSERVVLIDSKVKDRTSLAIDHQTQKMYWIEIISTSYETVGYIKSANLNGTNRTTLNRITVTGYAFSLAVSKGFIYWQDYYEKRIWKLPIPYTSQAVATTLDSLPNSFCWFCHHIAAHYTIEEQIQGIKSCDALQRLISNDSNSDSVSVCQNYCFQGECRVSAEGQPTCSCKAGYSGERCEVNACHKHCLNGGVCSLNAGGEPACQCAAGYDGERCDVSICKGYCLQGNCSVGADGQPNCRCEAGYSGERCEVNTCCQEYCLSGGFCSLNEEDVPAYQDPDDGGRCQVSANKDNSSDAGNSGAGTVSACHQFCLNDGVCSLSEARAPVCQCTPDYAGERCHVPAFIAKWAYKHVPPVTASEVKSTRASTAV